MKLDTEMIDRHEIDEKSELFQINTSDVQRDYVFGWILSGMYMHSNLKDVLILKGGNCFRKAYFENTRFSRDLDFSCERDVPTEIVSAGFNAVCDFVTEQTGIIFEQEKTIVQEKARIDSDKKIYDVRLYFKDFHGQSSKITISVRFDITRFDKIYLPVQERYLIHPYSDASQCKIKIKCIKLEELLASKLKCLLQRRHAADLYDYVYSVFINKSIDVSRSEVLEVFLKKTIYERLPGAARGLLLDLPFEAIRGLWDKFIVVPMQATIAFDQAITWFKENIADLFQLFSSNDQSPLPFFPSHLRNPIMEAGSSMTLLQVTYDGTQRIVEPYSLKYKVRKDGVGQEYFYVYDQTGGRSGPGIKTFVNDRISSIENTSEKFEPQFPVELSKAGEFGDQTYFSASSPRRRPARMQTRKQRTKSRSIDYGIKLVYIIECPYCNKQFQRKNHTTKLNKHKDRFGNPCFGRVGSLVKTQYK